MKPEKEDQKRKLLMLIGVLAIITGGAQIFLHHWESGGIWIALGSWALAVSLRKRPTNPSDPES